jgi:DNA-binding beta-propeller fold protein YncE
MVTESPPGPDNGDRARWGGVRAYFVRGSGAVLDPIEGIAASALADPAALTFRPSSSEVFVSNRHGNNGADGVAGSIARFVFDPRTRALTANGVVTGNGLAGVHQAAFSPVSGELFAANVNGGISRFIFDSAGNAVANGMIATGAARGVAVSPDGKRLYVSGATPVIQQFELPTGRELTRVSVGGANAALHYFAARDNELYVAGLTDNTIYRLAIGAADDPSTIGTVTASSPVAAAFSADGLEMFAVGHRDTHLIARFAAGDAGAVSTTWTATTAVEVSFSGGGVLVLSGGAPASIGPPGLSR